MLSRVALSTLFVAFLPLLVIGQGFEQTPMPTPPGPPAVAPPAAQKPPAQEPSQPGRGRRGQDVNVQVELTIRDQTGSAAPQTKTVSLIAADRTMGRVRAGATSFKPGTQPVGTNLNVDALPTLLENGRVELQLTIEYRPLRDSELPQEPTNLNESLTVILSSGKPLTISQAADPNSDRRMTVEVKATILK